MKRRKVLCRIEDEHGKIVVYTNGECRYGFESARSYDAFFHWKLHQEDGEYKFFYKSPSSDYFVTDWRHGYEIEMKMAKVVAEAIVNLEIEKMLGKK